MTMKHIATKINIETYIKFRYICRCHYYQPITTQLARLISQFISDFDKEHSEISIAEFISGDSE